MKLSEGTEEVLGLLRARVEDGESRYGPVVLELDTRDHVEEALNEVLDCLFYVSMKLLAIRKGYGKEVVDADRVMF